MPMKIRKNAVYSPYCTVCQYMKAHQDFRMACINSSYLNIKGIETLKQVMKRYGVEHKWTMVTMYNHFNSHQKKDVKAREEAKKREAMRDELEDKHLRKTIEKSPLAVSGVPIDILGPDHRANHELSLDEFIKVGRVKLDKGEMSITAATWLQAIKIKAEIEKSGKDRKVDLFKTMFKGAAPVNGNGVGQPES